MQPTFGVCIPGDCSSEEVKANFDELYKHLGESHVLWCKMAEGKDETLIKKLGVEEVLVA
jgi:hypothetical protein